MPELCTAGDQSHRSRATTSITHRNRVNRRDNPFADWKTYDLTKTNTILTRGFGWKISASTETEPYKWGSKKMKTGKIRWKASRFHLRGSMTNARGSSRPSGAQVATACQSQSPTTRETIAGETHPANWRVEPSLSLWKIRKRSLAATI